MANQIPLKFYQQPGTDAITLAPSYNTPFGYQEIAPENVDSVINAAIAKWSPGTTNPNYSPSDPWAQNYVKSLQNQLAQYKSGQSPYATDASGNLTTISALNEQDANAAAVKAGTMKNIGTADKPLYVPTGSPGYLLATDPGAYNMAFPMAKPASVAPTLTQQQSLYSGAAGYTGPSIVDFLNQAGQPSDMASRQKLAQLYGISNYSGTADQNTMLLNILRGITSGKTNDLGVPNSLNQIGSTPTPNGPIDLGSLSGGGIGDLSKILGVNLPHGFINSDIAGLLSLYGATSQDQKNYDALTQKLTDLMGTIGGEGADLQAAMNAQGVGANYDKVKELNLKASQLQGELDKFDAETTAGVSNLENQSIPTGLIVGQQAQLQKQRDLTRLSKAAELSATIALSQAYQGNAQLGMQLAQQAVDLKYAPIQNQIDVLKQQLQFAGDKLNKSDSARSNIISALITLKENDISHQKDIETQIQSMAITAASNGAPLSVVNAIKNSTDPVTAAHLSAGYVKKTSSNNSNNSNGFNFTDTQIGKGSANSGLSLADFGKLSNDAKNYFINNYSNFSALLKDVQSGDEPVADAVQVVNDSTTVPKEVKTILINQINAAAPQQSQDQGNGFWSNLWGNAWTGLKSFFGF